jgi:hypothetical protein
MSLSGKFLKIAACHVNKGSTIFLDRPLGFWGRLRTGGWSLLSDE